MLTVKIIQILRLAIKELSKCHGPFSSAVRATRNNFDRNVERSFDRSMDIHVSICQHWYSAKSAVYRAHHGGYSHHI